uniref:hypothetical protein n=1 Tax=Polynucleobacter sp. TaxID=2029855 RepID=UPI004047B52A
RHFGVFGGEIIFNFEFQLFYPTTPDLCVRAEVPGNTRGAQVLPHRNFFASTRRMIFFIFNIYHTLYHIFIMAPRGRWRKFIDSCGGSSSFKGNPDSLPHFLPR